MVNLYDRSGGARTRLNGVNQAHRLHEPEFGPEVRHRPAGFCHQPKGLAGIRSRPFDRVGNENDTGEAELRCYPGEPGHLDSGDPGCPVDHHDTAGEATGIRRHTCVTFKGVFQCRARQAGPAFKVHRGSRCRGKPQEGPASRDRGEMLQEHETAVIRREPETDHLVSADGESRERLPAGGIEGLRALQEFLFCGERDAVAKGCPGNDRLFRLDDAGRGEGAIHATALGLEELTIPPEPADDLLHHGRRVTPGCMTKGDGRKFRCGECGRLSFQVLGGAPDDVRHRTIRQGWIGRTLFRYRARQRPGAGESEALGPLPPLGPQRVEAPVDLAPPGDEGRKSGCPRCPGNTQAVEMLEDLAPPARERIEEGLIIARDLETRHPANHRGNDHETQTVQLHRQAIAVEGTDEVPVAAQRGRIHRTPPG